MGGFFVSSLHRCMQPGTVQGDKGGLQEGKIQLRALEYNFHKEDL